MTMTILIVVQVLLAIALTGMILVQRGKGAAAGAAFGGGASGTVFGSQGSASFLSRTTAVLAIGFFVISLAMAMIAGRSVMPTEQAPDLGVMSGTEATAPASDVPTLLEDGEQGVGPAAGAAEEVPTLSEPDAVLEVPTVLEEAAEATEAAAEDAEAPAKADADNN